MESAVLLDGIEDEELQEVQAVQYMGAVHAARVEHAGAEETQQQGSTCGLQGGKREQQKRASPARSTSSSRPPSPTHLDCRGHYRQQQNIHKA